MTPPFGAWVEGHYAVVLCQHSPKAIYREDQRNNELGVWFEPEVHAPIKPGSWTAYQVVPYSMLFIGHKNLMDTKN